MRKTLTVVLYLCFIISNLLAQTRGSNALNRYSNQDHDSFRHYLASKIAFDPLLFSNPGILLSGLVLDSNGNIENVFCLNSIHPKVDNQVLDIIEGSAGSWKSTSNSEKKDIIIVPINFYLKGVEHKLDTNDFKLPISEELMVTAIMGGEPADVMSYTSTKKLEKKCEKFIEKSKYNEASEILIELTKREPLNKDYYEALFDCQKALGNVEAATQIKTFISSYFQ